MVSRKHCRSHIVRWTINITVLATSNNTMTTTINKLNDFSSGRLCVLVDGDVAAQKEQSVSCLKVHSINSANSSVGSSKSGLDDLPPSETTSNNESQLGYKSPAGINYSRTESEAGSNCSNGSNDLAQRITDIEAKKKQAWSGVGRKQGIRIGSLNINGRRDEKRKDIKRRGVFCIK